jgi:hypothetical protein
MRAWLLLLTLLFLPNPAAAATALDELFGVYTGYARVLDSDGTVVEEREMDVIVAPYRRTGFRVRWVNVSLVGGRRDRPGVRRRELAIAFLPSTTGDYFVEAPDYDPFREREEVPVVAGRPLRWAVLDADGLWVHSFVVLGDGRYELQSYLRAPDGDGLRLVFERIEDGQVVRRIEGRAIRVGRDGERGR